MKKIMLLLLIASPAAAQDLRNWSGRLDMTPQVYATAFSERLNDNAWAGAIKRLFYVTHNGSERLHLSFWVAENFTQSNLSARASVGGGLSAGINTGAITDMIDSAIAHTPASAPAWLHFITDHVHAELYGGRAVWGGSQRWIFGYGGKLNIPIGPRLGAS